MFVNTRRSAGTSLQIRELKRLVVRSAVAAIQSWIDQRDRRRKPVDTVRIDVVPLVADVLVDVRHTAREARGDLLLEMRGELFAVRSLQVRVDGDSAGGGIERSDESADLLRAIDEPVAVQIVEPVARTQAADRVLDIGHRVGRVEVKAAVKRFDDRLSLAGDVVRETGARRGRRGARNGTAFDSPRAEQAREARIPGQCGNAFGRNILIRPAVGVVLDPEAEIQRQLPVHLPRVVGIRGAIVHVIGRRDGRVVDVHFVHRAAAVAIEDIERLILDEDAAVAPDFRAELEIVTARPAVLHVGERCGELRLVALLILIRIVAPRHRTAAASLRRGGRGRTGPPGSCRLQSAV